MVAEIKKKTGKVKSTVQFKITQAEAEELGRYMEITKIPIATMAKSGLFMRAKQLVKEQEAA